MVVVAGGGGGSLYMYVYFFLYIYIYTYIYIYHVIRSHFCSSVFCDQDAVLTQICFGRDPNALEDTAILNLLRTSAIPSEWAFAFLMFPLAMFTFFA
jgi:hypothetical protein